MPFRSVIKKNLEKTGILRNRHDRSRAWTNYIHARRLLSMPIATGLWGPQKIQWCCLTYPCTRAPNGWSTIWSPPWWKKASGSNRLTWPSPISENWPWPWLTRRPSLSARPPSLAGPHPYAAYAAFLANALPAQTPNSFSIIGSYGWGGKTVETLAGMIPNLKVEVIDPVLCKGVPSEDAFNALDNLAATIAQKHKEHGYK